MKIIILSAVTAAAVLAGCTESGRARREATFSDRAADITCWSYGTETYRGRSTGKIQNRDGGIAFVDAATGRYTVVAGECRLVYDAG